MLGRNNTKSVNNAMEKWVSADEQGHKSGRKERESEVPCSKFNTVHSIFTFFKKFICQDFFYRSNNINTFVK